MKKYFFLLLLMSATMVFALAQSSDSETPYLSQSFANAAIKNVEVSTSGGSISVAGVSPADARVEVYVNGNRKLSRDEIKQLLNEGYELTVTHAGDKLVAKATRKNQPFNSKKSLSISFRIYAPKAVSTHLHTSGGSIKLNDLEGNQKFKTSGGSLKVNNVSGSIDGTTSGGSIDVANCRNQIRLTTSGGSIDASNCEGTLQLMTSGGSLRLEALNGKIEATTSGGSIRANNIKGALTAHTSGGSVRLDNLSCSVNASTSGGSMSVSVKEPGKYVRVENSGGNIDLVLPKSSGLDLQLSGQKVNAEALPNFNGTMKNNTVEGTLNGGGTEVIARAGSGKINLSLQ